MPSLVLQLQDAALNPGVAISDLLRMALATATKLDVSEIEEWLRHELDGYRNDTPVPEYRKLRGELRARNPYQGWLPVQFQKAEQLERFSVCLIGDPISAIETMVEKGAVIGFSFPAEIDISLRKSMNYDVPIMLHVQSSTVQTILDAVRNRVLDWSLKLEKAGVLGEGMTFSLRDREQAQTINITGNVGIVGNLAGPANVAASSESVSQSVINTQAVLEAVDAFRPHIACLPEGQREDVERELTTLEAEAREDAPNPSLLHAGLRKIGKAVASIGDKVIEAGVKALVDKAVGG
jgi:hypothetical protein